MLNFLFKILSFSDMASLEDNKACSSFYNLNSVVAPPCILFVCITIIIVFSTAKHFTNPNVIPLITFIYDTPKYDRNFCHMVFSESKQEEIFIYKTKKRRYLECQVVLLMGIWTCKYFQRSFVYGVRY